MCDTICTLPNWSQNHHTMLAKNSDREPNEPHVIRFIPRQTYAAGKNLSCTYLDIPQAAETHAVLLYKPDWIWGAEMGVNEHGVAIGNEAVFTKAKNDKKALIGMDLLRLGLERGDSAEAAMDVIIKLLSEFGQGGNCGYSKDFRYDNSFLIADSKSAFILETSGRNYAIAEVIDKAAISNRLFIGREYTKCHGLKQGGDFAHCFTEPVFSHFAQGKKRRAQSLCAVAEKPVTLEQMMKALRTHAPGFDGHEFERGSVDSVCMHAGGLIGDHTTGSFVAVLRENAPMTIWSTGASTPCLSAFKPVFFGIVEAPVFEDELQGHAYWLKREQLHRAVLAGHVDAQALRARRDALEAAWIKEEATLFVGGTPAPEKLKAFAARAAAEEQAMIDEFYIEKWNNISQKNRFFRYWKKQNDTLK